MGDKKIQWHPGFAAAMDQRPAEDITVSMVRERKPEGLFRYFESHGIRIEKPYAGIYYVLDKVLFPTQLIVTKELDRKAHMWLSSLSNHLEKQEVRELLERVEGLTQEVEKQLADAVLEVSIRANQQVVEELRGDEGMCQALLEIMEPEINRIVEEATEKSRWEAEQSKKEVEKSRREVEGIRKEAKNEAERLRKEAKKETERLRREAKDEAVQTAKKMLKSGKFSVEETRECVPRLSVEEIEAIAKELGQI